MLLRRLALLGSMLLCLSVTFTAAAIATDAHIAGSLSIQGKGGGPGGLLPAGNYLNLFVNTGYSLQQRQPARRACDIVPRGRCELSGMRLRQRHMWRRLLHP